MTVETIKVPILARLESLPSELPTEAEIAAEQAERERQAATLAAQRQITADLGRFKDCRVNNYVVEYEPQARVVARLVEIAAQIIDGEIPQLCWWGSVGTGKDHLAAAMLKHAASRGISCRWVEARTFCQQMAGAYQNDSSQEKVLREWAQPKVLCLSDAVAFDQKSNHREYIGQLVRARYNAGRSTWLTINVPSLDQAGQAIGADVWSRLSERQVALECKWPDYRRSVSG